nr:PREDICTED: PLAC8-like protein 1 [Latimeria chalumnae]|eukprot:XP_014343934.1 PREDICTED: PLAC8-like protein 1 [Latimeria chalumnae]
MMTLSNTIGGTAEDIYLKQRRVDCVSLMSPEVETFVVSHSDDDKWKAVSLAPIINQPRHGATTTTVTAILQTGGDWNSSIFNVLNDKKVCLCGSFCLSCLECHLAQKYGECCCLPLLPGSTFALRVSIREKFKIQEISVC